MGTSAPARPEEGGAAPTAAVAPPRQATTAGRPAPDAGRRAVLRGSLRMPGPRDMPPRPARLFCVCAWAATLGLLGLPVAARASVATITGQAPGWLEPTVVSCGLAGICLTAASFAAIHRRRLPWLLLAAASVALVVNGYLTLLL